MNTIFFISTILPQTASQSISLWDMILKGGWLMIPIFILSVIGIYIICERFAAIRKAGKTDRKLTTNVMSAINRGNKTGALQECAAQNTPLSRMLQKGILLYHIPAHDLRTSMENTATLEIAELEKGLPTLATVSGLAPMIGFLGTVVGMVQAFYDMSLAGNNINITLLSRGIYTAMITTVAGLIVGILAYFAYNFLVTRINSLANEMENACTEFIDSLYECTQK
ncbi:MAG: MotA/TolQ/ExbB proton channel family protein [Oscillibacter sp.]|nr:MotA/TolQ/ExbB proton channel family protein [Oscillibacter sp.]